MIEKEKLDRINELSRKRKSEEGLTEEEAQERQELHREYIDAVKSSLRSHLDNITVVDEEGKPVAGAYAKEEKEN